MNYKKKLLFFFDSAGSSALLKPMQDGDECI
jgi:hypothetical protein